MPHKQIAEYLYEKHGLSRWWSQVVTVVYEQKPGLREKHQKSDGSYVICVSKVLPVSINTLHEFWSDGNRRNQWLTHENYNTVTITISKTTMNKSMHIVWNEIKKKITTNNSRDNHNNKNKYKTRVDVNFYDKDTSKSQVVVVVQHSKLSNLNEVEKMRSYWKKAVERLTILVRKVN
jgi:hypothetical protein